jgi:spore coat protein U-like protein
MSGDKTLARCAWLCLVFLGLSFSSPAARAAISCSISSPGISTAYGGIQATGQSDFTISCSRLSSDPATSTYEVRPDHGINSSAQQNRAGFSTYFLEYGQYQDSGCSLLWSPTGPSAAISGTINFGSALSVSVQADFWACLPASQTYAAGSYSDTVTMTLIYDTGAGNTMVTGTHQVLVSAQPSCSFTTAPGDINFDYTALQVAAAQANTTFGITCTVLASASMGLVPAAGVISGLNYQLQLNSSSSGGSNPLDTSGSGAQQLFYINATMPAGQAGECATGACADSNIHTLTLTF